MKTFQTGDESELGNKVLDLVREGYEPSEQTDQPLKPGQFRRSVDVDHEAQQPVFTLTWVEFGDV